MNTEIHALPYNRAGEALRFAIARLQHRAYPALIPPPEETFTPEHDPALDALSFYLADNGRIISYAAVVHLSVIHAGETYRASGLSCVATDPDFRRRGLGTRVIAVATRAILDSDADLGLFTCDPPLTDFYTQVGWSLAPNVVLIGNRMPGALSSATLGKGVLIRLISARAQAAAESLEQSVLDLNLPAGQFV